MFANPWHYAILSSFLGSRPEPIDKLGLAKFPRGQPFDGSHRVMRIECQAEAVSGESQARNNPSGALVSVNKRVVANDSVRISSSQSRSIERFVRREVARARQSGIKRARLTHSARATVLSQLAVVDSLDNVLPHPSPALHFDKARSTSRSSCMISSAIVIWCSNSGS